MERLTKGHFAGGTVEVVTNAAVSAYRLHPTSTSALEDGTVNFRAFPSLRFGLTKLQSIPRHLISQRTRLLASWLAVKVQSLRYPGTGHPVVRIVGFPVTEEGQFAKDHGSTLSLVFYSEDGVKVPSLHIEKLAIEAGIEIREGCVCNVSARLANPGTAGYWDDVPDALALVDWKYDSLSDAWKLVDIGREEIASQGVIRVSLGLPSTFRDVYAFYSFVRSYSTTFTREQDRSAIPAALDE